MTMTATSRNIVLTTHVITSVGWLGALVVFIVHSLAGLISGDEQTVRAVYLAMGITAWFVILPLSLCSLTTGLVQAFGTAWGLLRHYWILFKLLFTAIATIVLLLKLAPISYLAEAAAEATFPSADLLGLQTSVMVHAIGGLLVLLTAVVLAVYKPQGMTPYGLRKLQQRGGNNVDTNLGSVTSTPQWVKVFVAGIVILILAVALMLLGGGHGPGAHLSSNG